MKKLIFGLIVSSAISALGQSLNVFPLTTSGSPKQPHIYGTSSCAAIVNGENDQRVNWTTTGGTLITSSTPSITGPQFAGLYSTTTGTFTLTATSRVNGALSASCTITFTGAPTPASGHPRFLATTSSLAALQAKGLGSNALYSNGIQSLAATTIAEFGSYYTWSTWSGSACTGGSGPTSDVSQLQAPYIEQGLLWVSSAALLDNSSTNRNTYGCQGRQLLLSTMSYIIAGTINPESGGGRWGDGMSPYGFVIAADNLMAGGYLTSADLTLVRQYFVWWGVYLTTNPSGNGIAPAPLKTSPGYNSIAMFVPTLASGYTASQWAREAANNYTNARILMLAILSLTFNDNTTDDPPLTGIYNTCGASRYQMCPDGTAGSLHAYWYYATGAILYLEWGTFEDPTIVQTSYNTAFSNMATPPTCAAPWGGVVPCLGINGGGEPVEGLIYGGSSVKVQLAMNAIRNAGWDDPHLWGPQIDLEDTSYWDLRYLSDATQLKTLNAVPPVGTGLVGAGGWDFLTSGDTQTYYLYPSYIATESAIMAYDASLPTPRTDRTNALNWITLNSAWGMADGTHGICSTHGFGCGYIATMGDDYGSQTSLQMFLALPAGNPVTTSPPTDPRPGFPTDWYDTGNKHLVLRNNWSSGYTVFSFLATDTQVDHEHQYDGRFEINANGYDLTKGRTIFNNYNTWVTLPRYENLVGLPNSTTSGYPANTYPFGPSVVLGGQIWHGYQNGVVPFAYSTLPTYAAMHVDNTNAYNGVLGTNTNDILASSREVIYLRSLNQVVYYDRATVGHSASTQTSYFNTTGAVTFSGSRAKWLDQSGTQSAYFTPIYPSGATITATPWYNNLTLSAPDTNLQNGTTMQATATANYADASTQNAFTFPDQIQGGFVQFSTGTPSLCSVNATSGLITAAASGTGQCQILATYTFGGIVWTPAAIYPNIVTGSSGGGAITGIGGESGADWQPEFTLSVKPSGTPTSTNFGSVMQWGTSSFTPATTSSASSSAGQAYDGIIVGATAVWFMRATPVTFTGVTVPASSATTQYVTNTTPNTTYAITGTGAPATATSDNAGVLEFGVTGTGNLVIAPAAPPTVPFTLSGITASGVHY